MKPTWTKILYFGVLALLSCGKPGGVAPDTTAAAGATGTSTAANCSGTLVGGYCWYAGASGASCTATCTGHGGYNAATESYAGSASGSDAHCLAVLTALNLGSGGMTDAAYGGQGCFLAAGVFRDWSTDPADANSSGGPSERACACNN